jgi:membrane protease YdiL (CAAX protease family)
MASGSAPDADVVESRALTPMPESIARVQTGTDETTSRGVLAFAKRFLTFLLFIVAGLAILIGTHELASWLSAQLGASKAVAATLKLVGLALACAGLVTLNLRFGAATSVARPDMGFTFSPRLARGALFGLVAAVVTGALTVVLSWLLLPLHVVITDSALSAIGGALYLFFTAGLQATCEELLFRAWAVRWLGRLLGTHATALLVGVVFGAAHLLNANYTLAAMLNAGVAGVMLTYAVLQTRSLALPIALHLGWNWITGVAFLPELVAVTTASGARANPNDCTEATPWGLGLVVLLAVGVVLTTRPTRARAAAQDGVTAASS